MNFSNTIDGLSLQKFDALQSPAHYVKKEEGNYEVVKLGCCKSRYLSYHAEKIKLFFNRLGHFFVSGCWETNKTLLTHLYNRVNEINTNKIEITDTERQALQKINKNLLARISGQMAKCALDIFQTINSPDQSDAEAFGDEEPTERSEVELELEREEKDLEKDKKEIQLKEAALKESENKLKKVLSQEIIVDLAPPLEQPKSPDNELKKEANELVLEIKKELSLVNEQIKQIKQEKLDLSTQHDIAKEAAQKKKNELEAHIKQLQQEKLDFSKQNDITKEDCQKKEKELDFQIEKCQQEKLDLSKQNIQTNDEVLKNVNGFMDGIEKSQQTLVMRVDLMQNEVICLTNKSKTLQSQHDIDAKTIEELKNQHQQQEQALGKQKRDLLEREKRIAELQNTVQDLEKQPELCKVKQKREISLPSSPATAVLNKENFYFIDLLKADDNCFRKYCSFIAPLAKEAQVLATHGKDSPHANFKKYVKDSNKVFRAGLEAAKNNVSELNKKLLEQLKGCEGAEPRFSEDSTILICSAATLKAAFELVRADSEIMRLYTVAFSCDANGLAIDQKAEVYRLIQQVICGVKACENKPLPTSPYCFGIAEISNKAGPQKVSTAVISKGTSYLFTQAMDSNASIKENREKFQEIGKQYVKDACERGGQAGSLVDVNGTILSYASEAVEQIRDTYTNYLSNLEPEDFNKILKEDSQSPLVMAALKAYSDEDELQKAKSVLKERLIASKNNEIEGLNAKLNLIEKKLKQVQKIKEDCQKSAFPESILQAILQNEMDYWCKSTEKQSVDILRRIKATVEKAAFKDSEIVTKLAKNNNCKVAEVEPLIRYKILELICSLNQSVQYPLAVHAKEDINLYFAGEAYVTKPVPPTKIRFQGDRYETLSMQFDVKYSDFTNPERSFMVANLELTIANCSQDSKATYQAFKDARLSFETRPEDIDLVVKQMKPLDGYLEDLYNDLKKDVLNLSTISALSGGGELFYKNEKFEIDHGILGTGFVRPYIVPAVNVIEALVDTFKKVRKKLDALDKNLSPDKKKGMLGDINRYLTLLEAVQTKLDQVVAKADKSIIKFYGSIVEELSQIKMIGHNWSSMDLIKEPIDEKNLSDFVEHADVDAIRESLKSSTDNIEISQDQATGYLKEAYGAYWKRFTESTDHKDFMWKTEKYDQLIGGMQAFIKDELPNATEFKEVVLKEGVGQSLSKLFEILDEMKVDPNNRPEDYRTLNYQKRVRNMYQRFFIHLSVASEEAITYKGSEQIEKKCVDIILKLCGHFFNGINMKETSIHAVEAFYPLVDLKDKGLCKAVKEAYESIKHADPYKKTPMHHGIWKSLIGHFNIGFNSWLAGNPVSQWFNTKFGNGSTVALLAFGSPTSEKSPTLAEVIAPFRAAMKQYAEKGDNHLYVSLQNFIPVKKQKGWKEQLLMKCPSWIAGAAETLLGGDETNRCEALKKFEQSEEGKALFFMTLSKNSQFYNNPESKQEGVDVFAASKAFKNELFKQIFTGKPEETGTYISAKIRDFYKEAATQDLEHWGNAMIEKIHLQLFADPQNKGEGRADLTLEERKIFIEVVYYFLTTELAQKLPKLKSMNTSCKDDIDRGIGESTKNFGIMGIVNGQENEEKFIQEFVTQVFARALFARQREIIAERMEVLLKVIDFTLHNKVAMRVLHEEVWGSTMPSAKMI